MLIKQLSDEDKKLVFCLAELISIADKPLLWKGEATDLVREGMAHGDIVFQRKEAEMKALEELCTSAPHLEEFLTLPTLVGPRITRVNVHIHFVRRIKALPLLTKIDDAVRINAATDMLRVILKDKQSATPSVPKLMLFELVMLALSAGAVSPVQRQLLDEFCLHYQIEEFMFDDLFERARTMHREVQKTIAIILE
jgi:hypothetical protein